MRTLKYVLKRLLFLVITFFVILTITFCLIKTLQSEIPLGPSGETELARRKALGWDRPVLEQYGIYLKNFFTEKSHVGPVEGKVDEEGNLTLVLDAPDTIEDEKTIKKNLHQLVMPKLGKDIAVKAAVHVSGQTEIKASDIQFLEAYHVKTEIVEDPNDLDEDGNPKKVEVEHKTPMNLSEIDLTLENPDLVIATFEENKVGDFNLDFEVQRIMDSPLFDLGVSLRVAYMMPVAEVIASKLPPTILINVLSILVGLPLGIVLGIFAALKKNTWIDHIISVVIVLFISVPSFVLAFFMQYAFAFKLGWFPLQMYSNRDAGGLVTWKMIYSLMLPIMASAFYEIAYFARTVRAELTESLTSDYMLLARTKGLTQSKAIIHHALKNAMVPILPVVIGTFLSIMGGSMVLERIFGIPGIGDLTLKALQGPDYDLFVGTAMFYTLIGLLAGILTDLSYGFLDPRIKMGER